MIICPFYIRFSLIDNVDIIMFDIFKTYSNLISFVRKSFVWSLSFRLEIKKNALEKKIQKFHVKETKYNLGWIDLTPN